MANVIKRDLTQEESQSVISLISTTNAFPIGSVVGWTEVVYTDVRLADKQIISDRMIIGVVCHYERFRRGDSWMLIVETNTGHKVYHEQDDVFMIKKA